MNTKQELYDALDQKISKSALKLVDGEYRAVGRYGYISKNDAENEFDVWIVNTRDLSKPLSTRKVRSLLNLVQGNRSYRELDGEGYTTLQGTHLLTPKTLRLLGIRPKRVLTPEQLHLARARAVAMHTKKTAADEH